MTPMSAYIIADVKITNEAQMVEYRQWAHKAQQEFGVEPLVRGGGLNVLEGNWQPQRIVVLKFRDREHAMAYYDSANYRHARKLREDAGSINMIVVDGFN
jgi:uncharacterized protein (DUF1330 family)